MLLQLLPPLTSLWLRDDPPPMRRTRLQCLQIFNGRCDQSRFWGHPEACRVTQTRGEPSIHRPYAVFYIKQVSVDVVPVLKRNLIAVRSVTKKKKKLGAKRDNSVTNYNVVHVFFTFYATSIRLSHTDSATRTTRVKLVLKRVNHTVYIIISFISFCRWTRAQNKQIRIKQSSRCHVK